MRFFSDINTDVSFADPENFNDSSEFNQAVKSGDRHTLYQLLYPGITIGNKELLLALKNGQIETVNVLQCYRYHATNVAPQIHLFNHIFNSAMLQINRMRFNSDHQHKDHIRKILSAITRLCEAVLAKQGEFYRPDYDSRALKNDICIAELHRMDLSTIDMMLNARFSTWVGKYGLFFCSTEGSDQVTSEELTRYRNLSLREALNNCGETRLNYIGFTFDLSFKKTKALDNVERELSALTSEQLYQKSTARLPHLYRPTFRPEDNIQTLIPSESPGNPMNHQ